jgi:glycosyltransferase involved in cell wall biosynthesis
MKLTCVTATFNCLKSGSRESLVRCVESVARLGTEHEHLVYDGGSRDGTAELLAELAAKTPGLKVVSEPDTGIYNALNKGVRDAKGEWFYVLGADDYLSRPDVMDALLSGENSVFDVIVAPVERDVPEKLYQGPGDMKSFLLENPHSHQGLLMKTDVVRRCGGFDESFAILADWDLAFKTHEMSARYLYTRRPFAFFSGGGLSATLDEKSRLDEIYRIFKRHLGIEGRRASLCRKHRYVPVSKVAGWIFHEDLAFRAGSRWLVLMFAKELLRLALFPLVWASRPLRRRLAAARKSA